MNARPSATRARVRLGVAGLVTAIVVGGAVLGTTAPPEPVTPPCPPSAYQGTSSVARRWDDALLDAIRRSLPQPPVHARNLFHVSIAMWDAWAAYDTTAGGYLIKEKLNAPDVPAARNEAVSYAAYRVLSARFIRAVGADKSLSEFDDLMDTLCFPISITGTDGNAPAAVGNRIAKTVLDYGKTDGSNETNAYAATGYAAVNPPLVVAQPGITLDDPNRWQPLQIEHSISQNGIAVTNAVQQAIEPHWGHVIPFAITAGGASGTPIDPGPPPRFGEVATDAIYREQAVEVLRDS